MEFKSTEIEWNIMRIKSGITEIGIMYSKNYIRYYKKKKNHVSQEQN